MSALPKLKTDLATIREAAANGATWSDLAALIGVTDRTLRRWRNSLATIEQENETGSPLLEIDSLLITKPQPPPDYGVAALEAIAEGRREARESLVAEIRAAATTSGDTRAMLALLSRLDAMDS
ncbi:MAG: hypothetical protein OXM87_11250 [Truepera sp.]|nr:hypothetical protein [Truepera sp.]